MRDRVINKQQLCRKTTNLHRGERRISRKEMTEAEREGKQPCKTSQNSSLPRQASSPQTAWKQTSRVNEAVLSRYHCLHPLQQGAANNQQIILHSFLSPPCCTENPVPARSAVNQACLGSGQASKSALPSS